jgi:arsenate reductase
MAVELLGALHYPTEHLRSKSWNEFARAGSPPLDFVFTVCDKAAGEACPLWPGQPMTAHWGVEDPAAFVGPREMQRRIFTRIYFELETRIKIFASLRLDDLDSLVLQRRLDEIGRGAAG